MADRKPLKVLPDGGGDSTGLAEFVAGDTLGVVDGGTGLATVATSNILTGNGTSALSAETSLTFDGTDLAIGNAAPSSYMNSVHGLIIGDTGDATSEFVLATNGSGKGEINWTSTVNTTNQASIHYAHNTTAMSYESTGGHFFSVAGTEYMRLQAGKAFLNETSDGNISEGLCLQQNANSGTIFALKSTTVAHSITDVAEADTYGTLSKSYPDYGGLRVTGFVGEDAQGQAIMLEGITSHASPQSAKGTANNAIIVMGGYKASGSAKGNLAANENIVSITGASGHTKFIFDADGDSHQDVGTAWTNFDDHDDVALTRSLGIALDPASIIQTKWDDWGKDHFREMEDFGLINKIGDEEKAKGERGLVNMTLLAKLHNGAIGQLGAALNDMKEVYQDKIAALEARLMRLEN